MIRFTLFRSSGIPGMALAALLLAAPLASPAQTSAGSPETGHRAADPGAPGGSGTPSAAAPGSPAPGSAAKAGAAPAVMQLKKQIQGGDFAYRFVSAGGETALTSLAPLPAATGSDVMVGVPAGINSKTAQLEVLDNTHGNLARFPLFVDIHMVPKPLAESSFTFAQRINIPVQKGGLGVIGVQVTLADATKSYNKTTTLQASDNGVARFDNVPLNKELTATVSYADHKLTVTQTLPAVRVGDGWAPMVVDWPDIKTVAASTAAPTPAAARAEGADRGARRDASDAGSSGPFSGVLSTLVSLVFLGAIFYGLYWLYQSGRLKNVLDKLGLSSAVMAPEAGAVAAQSPFDRPAARPIQPITEGTADPFGPGAGAAAGIGAAAPVAAGPRLVATMGTYAGTIFPLMGPSTDIGRDAANPIPLPNDTNASRRHATVQMVNGQATLTDNGSSNGTYLNGVRIPGQTPQPLRSGDEVNIGNTRFRFEA